jgi:hypothetical protein
VNTPALLNLEEIAALLQAFHGDSLKRPDRDQAERRLRPRARRAAITFAPPFVAMRARKP